MENNKIISQNIKSLRISHGYTQAYVAEYLNISAAAVNQYENDARTVPVWAVEKLALLYNLDEYDLYEENPEKKSLITSFAFRAGELSSADMQNVSRFRKIVLNYINMSAALKNG
jgi:transcriptional regulator with XRE-family HTH domain